MRRRYQAIPATLCLGLYLIALLLPAANPYAADRRTGSLRGYEAFQVGWNASITWRKWDIDVAMLTIGWLANPLILVGIASLAASRRRSAALVAATAALLQLGLLGRYHEIVLDQPGYWCWVMCSVSIFGCSALTAGNAAPERGPFG